MISNSTNLVLEIYNQITSIMQSTLSREEQKTKITDICVRIISQDDKTITELTNSREILKGRVADLLESINRLQTENQSQQLRLEKRSEKIQQLANDILKLKKEKSVDKAEFEKAQHQLSEADLLLQGFRSELSNKERELQTTNARNRDLEQMLNESSLQCEMAISQVAELENRRARDAITIQRLAEENVNFQHVVEQVNAERIHLANQCNETLQALQLQRVKFLAEEKEVKRLKKAYIEDTMVRWVLPHWQQKVEEELATKKFFFTYFNPISSTPWLTLCDQKSLSGREKNLTRWLDTEMQNFPHLREIEALTQLLNRLGYGHLIRSEEVYIQEYVALNNSIQ